MQRNQILSEQVKQILKKHPLSEQFEVMETEEKALRILENFDLPNLPIVEAKWDERLQCLVLPKEELEDWEWDD